MMEATTINERSDVSIAASATSGIDRSIPVPFHVQIAEVIRERLDSGAWPVHYRFKPEPDLATEFGVSRGTLRKALATLLAEGRLVQVRGKGTFVTATQFEPALAQDLTTLSEDFAEKGITADVDVLESRIGRAPRKVAGLLDVDQETPMLLLRRVRSTAEGPIAYLVNYVRADLAPGIEDTNFLSASLFGALESEHGLVVATARRTFIAEAAGVEVSSALGVVRGSPVQYLQQVSYLADSRAIEYSDVWINSDRMRVTSLLSRRGPV